MDGAKEDTSHRRVTAIPETGASPRSSEPGGGEPRVHARQPTADAADDALDSLIERWRGPLVGFAFALGAADAVALAQDTLAEAWIGRARFRGDLGDDTAVGGWLRGIARNLVRTETRRTRGRPRSLHELEEPPAKSPAAEAALEPEAVRAAVDALPPDQREAVWMHHLEGTPVRRVAALLGVTERTIEGRLYRARRALARRLGTQRQGEV